MSWLVGDDQRVHVALNHRLAAALLAPGYAQLLLSERLRLPSQTAMLVHAFLSTCLGVGKDMRIRHETLVERLWPSGRTVVPASTQRRRLNDVRAALRAIGRLERWEVKLGTTDATVRRLVSRASVESVSKNALAARAPEQRAVPGQTVRDMTRPGHFAVQDASFGEQPFWEKLSTGKDLSRNDEGRTTSE